MRRLSDEEITYVLGDIKSMPNVNPNVAENVHSRILNVMKTSLRQVEVYPDVINDLKRQLTKQYYASQVQPGESIGVLTAQSIGERQTQLSLDSFHSAGITSATVVTGVPRFNELMNTSKKPKNVMSTIYLKKEYTTIQGIRDNAGIRIKHVVFKDIFNGHSLKKTSRDFWYVPFHIINPGIKLTKSYTHFIRCECRLDVLYAYKLLLADVCRCITDAFDDLICIWSPDILGIIYIWVNSDNIEVPENSFITEENKLAIYSENVILPALFQVTINGIVGIEHLVYTQCPRTSIWNIEAMGFNLKQLLATDIIDATRTVSNHMWEIHDTLGVEATREFLINEFVNIISMDSYINRRHIQLLVDVMLYTGTISSISRYGVHKNQSGALSKCSFEESLDQFLSAGIYGEKEHIDGVSGAIICGKLSNAGTGLCDLVYNEKKIES